MNSKDRNPDYKRIYSIVKRIYEGTEHFRHGPFDETFFTMRVYETAKEIMGKLDRKCDRNKVLVAAIVHDVGKSKLNNDRLVKGDDMHKDVHKEWHRHAKLGVPIARRILRDLGHSEEFISDVLYLVENHDHRIDDGFEKTLELKILQDADLIADCGFAGFIRPFLFGGKFKKQSIVDSILYMQNNKNRVANTKLLNLGVSRRIATRRFKLEQKLINKISEEIVSDLL
jgi:HD superfamily phosphodiesterase